MSKKMKCPECGSLLYFSRWTGDSHCTNIKCWVTVKADGSIYHRPDIIGQRKLERLGKQHG